MSEQTFNFTDKSNWPTRGEWDKEPDKILWIDEDTGLDCMIHRNGSGSLCGYVGVPESSQHHGIDYDDVSVLVEGEKNYPEVHGGLTFSSGCQEQHDDGGGICHSGNIAHQNVWWLGFDCAHSGDFCPKYQDEPFQRFSNYKDVSYVKNQVRSLAQQLSA